MPGPPPPMNGQVQAFVPASCRTRACHGAIDKGLFLTNISMSLACKQLYSFDCFNHTKMLMYTIQLTCQKVTSFEILPKIRRYYPKSHNLGNVTLLVSQIQILEHNNFFPITTSIRREMILKKFHYIER